MIADVWQLSQEEGFYTLKCNYEVVKDYCKECDLETLEVFRVCKQMVIEFSKKDKKAKE